MNQQLQQILSTLPPKDQERLKWEIEAKGEYDTALSMILWPSSEIMAVVFLKVAEYYNSQGKQIATFKLKEWK